MINEIHEKSYNHQNNPKAEFNKLKIVITSLNDKNKLHINSHSELTLKHRKPIKAQIGASIKSQIAINDAVIQLLAFSRKEIPAEELLTVTDHLKRNEWGSEALKHDPVKNHFTMLENFLKAKFSMAELEEKYRKNDKECYSLDSSASSEDFDKLDELESSFKNKRLVHDNLKGIIDNLLKSQTTPNSSSNSLRGGKG